MRTKQGSAQIRTPRHTIEDIDLENRIANYLHQRHIPHGERIHMDAQVGTVIVNGQLPSQRTKWLCLECCRRVAGVINLIDNVVVKPDVCQKRSNPHSSRRLRVKSSLRLTPMSAAVR